MSENESAMTDPRVTELDYDAIRARANDNILVTSPKEFAQLRRDRAALLDRIEVLEGALRDSVHMLTVPMSCDDENCALHLDGVLDSARRALGDLA